MPDIFPKALPYTLKPDDQVYFLHVAKTGGRSFEAFLKKYFQPEQTIRIDVEHGYPANIPPHVLTDYRLYLGHLGYHFLSLFPETRQPLWITMLRDPVDRVISYYYFFRNVQPVSHGHSSYRYQVLASTLSLLEFVRSEETAELVNNYQFNTLVDSEMLYYNNATGIKHRRHAASPAELLSLLKHRLQDECIYFGITEHYDTSIALLCYTFNWDLPAAPFERLNVTPDRPRCGIIDTEVIDAIRNKVDLDIEIYEFASGLFEKRVSDMVNHLLADRKCTRQNHSPISLYIADGHDVQSNATAGRQARELILQKVHAHSLTHSRAHRLLSELRDRLGMLRLRVGRRLGTLKTPLLFDPEWYLSHNADVASSKMDPYIHYKLWGWKEGRDPSAGFDIAWYLSNNPDVLEAGAEPLDHYVNHGKREHRSPRPPAADPSSQSMRETDFAQFHPSRSGNGRSDAFRPRLCFHFLASPNDSFFSQIAMFRLALDSFGGMYEEADIIITLGDNEIRPVPARWKDHLGKRVIFNWAEPEKFRQLEYDAQGDAQWTYDHERYDVICILDADVMMTRPIDDLLINMLQSPAMIGTIAHYPFPSRAGENPQQQWNSLAQRFIEKPLEFKYRYTLAEGQPDGFTFSPFYLNFGFLLLTPAILQSVRGPYLDLRPKIALELAYPYYSGQTSLALTIAAHDIPARAVGLRYNFPNDGVADRLHLNELSDVRVIHYLRTEQFDRHRIFTSRLEFDRFLALALTGSNEIFQNHIRRLTNGTYPF